MTETKKSRRGESKKLVEYDTLRDGIEGALDGTKGTVTRAVVIAEVELDEEIELVCWAFQGDHELPDWALDGMMQKAYALLSEDPES